MTNFNGGPPGAIEGGNSISGLAHMLPRERGGLNIWLCAPGKRYAVECKANLSGYS
ncbi:UNVERIFIED_ORG: hypothetical protein M2355_001673 [Lelliottia amnigena]|nr:hypothetical protein [Lelliottia amnigena]